MDTITEVHSPIPVTVKNWDDSPKPKACLSTFQTYSIDPTQTNKTWVEIAAYEPKRERLVIQPIDAPIVAYLNQPTSPDAASAIATPYSGQRLLVPLAVDRVGNVINTPALGAEELFTVPAGESWRLDNILFRLVTSGVAGSRQMTLIIDDGNPANVIYTLQPSAAQVASLTQDYIFSVGSPEIAIRGGLVQEPLPQLMLASGSRIRSFTTGKDAGDQYGVDVINFTKLQIGNGIGLYEFFGNDAMWVNSITGAPTRFTVLKEYRSA